MIFIKNRNLYTILIVLIFALASTMFTSAAEYYGGATDGDINFSLSIKEGDEFIPITYKELVDKDKELAEAIKEMFLQRYEEYGVIPPWQTTEHTEALRAEIMREAKQ